MITQRHILSDTEIICLISHNNFLGWRCLYNKYALMMYVAILWVTDNKVLTEEIMSLLFVQLKTDKRLLESKTTLRASLLHQTYGIAYKMLKINNMRTGQHAVQHDSCPVLTDLLKDATDIAEADAKQVLRSEVNRIRDKYLKEIKLQKDKKQVVQPHFATSLSKNTVANAN